MRKWLYAATIAVGLSVTLFAQGGAFIPSLDYSLSGLWTFTGSVPVISNLGGVLVGSTATQTLTNKTLTSPTFTAPVLGVATATSINGNIFTTGSSTYTGTAAQTYTFPTTSATIARTDAANTFTGVQTMTSAALTTPVIATITNTGTVTLPSATGAVASMLYCGSTGTGNQTCSATAAAATAKLYAGHSTLSSNAAVITWPVAFASTTYDCVANDITTRANPVQMISTSTTTATITNTTGASDVINWVCVGQ